MVDLPADQAAAAASVVCVIVTFDPDQARFEAVLAAVRPQVDRIVLVDNGSQPARLEWLRALADGIDLLELGCNAGVAAAQNVG
ncbi:MAG: hypothetical protein AB7O55_29540, partial [Lautropia sp.]